MFLSKLDFYWLCNTQSDLHTHFWTNTFNYLFIYSIFLWHAYCNAERAERDLVLIGINP